MNSDEVAEARIESRSRGWASVSLVWLLPLAAVLFAGWALYQNWKERGPIVSIQFNDAGGVQAGATAVRRNDVEVGRVEAVELADDLDSVIIKVRMDPRVEPWIDADTRFWIVNARFTTTEISGLGTLLSGAYVEVDWDDERGEERSEFVGLEEAPLVRRSEAGLRLSLAAEEAGYIYPGSPVFYRQVEVGRVERRRISEDGHRVLFDIFIRSPYRKHIYPQSHFFSVSGVEGRVDADGVAVRVESLSAFFTGGVGIDNPPETQGQEPLGSDPLAEIGVFKLYESRSAAADSLVDEFDDPAFRYSVRFKGSIKGLSVNAPVEYNGLRVGRVVSAAVALPDEPRGDPIGEVVLQLQPQRLGMSNQDEEAFYKAISDLVDSGLRAQLASANILTGALLVKLVLREGLPSAQIVTTAQPYPELPALPSNVEALTADVESIVANLAALPLDSLVESIVGLVDDTREIVADPALAALPRQLGDSLDSLANAAERIDQASEDLPEMLEALTRASQNADIAIRGLSPDSRIYVEMSAAARELRQAARSIAAFAEYLERNPNALITGR